MSIVTAPDYDAAIVRALGDFCAAFLRLPAPEGEEPQAPVIVRGYMNRVSKPAGRDYVLVTPMAMARLGTNRHGWDAQTGTETVTQPTRRRVQLDCYGVQAAVWAKTLATLLRDRNGADFLAAYGMAPLYCEDPLDLTQAEGDEQWNPRFMVAAMLQVNDTAAVGLDYFTNVNLYLFPQA